MIEKAIIVVLTGIIVGLINSMAGGGMLIGFPLLLSFGMTALVANATSNVILLAGQFTASYGYKKYLKKIKSSYYLLLIPSLVGGVIGAYILRRTPNAGFAQVAPWLVLVAVLLFVFQPYIKQHIYRVPDRVNQRDRPSTFIYILVFILSVYGGYFGAGYGLVMLAILSLTKMKSILEMNGFKNLCAFAITISSLAVLFNSHLINWRYGITMAIGTAIGGYVGARIAQHLKLGVLRYMVIIIGLGTSIYLFSQMHLS